MTHKQKQDRPNSDPVCWTILVMKWGRAVGELERAMGDEIERIEVADRELAVAIAHHLLDKHAHEAFGETGLEVHIAPPKQPSSEEPSGFRKYKVTPEARKQAQALGIRGDVEARVARMARMAARFTHPEANWRFQRFIMRIEHGTVTWIGLADASRGSGKAE